MTDAARLRAQKAASSDPDYLERMAVMADYEFAGKLKAAIEMFERLMLAANWKPYTELEAVLTAARRYLMTLPAPLPEWKVRVTLFNGIVEENTFPTYAAAIERVQVAAAASSARLIEIEAPK